MVSIAELVQESDTVLLKQGIVLVLPEGRAKKQLLGEARNGVSRFTRISPGALVRSDPFREQHNPGTETSRVYIIAPGKWNNHSGYYALVCRQSSVMVPMQDCGYVMDPQGNWVPKSYSNSH